MCFSKLCIAPSQSVQTAQFHFVLFFSHRDNQSCNVSAQCSNQNSKNIISSSIKKINKNSTKRNKQIYLSYDFVPFNGFSYMHRDLHAQYFFLLRDFMCVCRYKWFFLKFYLCRLWIVCFGWLFCLFRFLFVHSPWLTSTHSASNFYRQKATSNRTLTIATHPWDSFFSLSFRNDVGCCCSCDYCIVLIIFWNLINV